MGKLRKRRVRRRTEQPAEIFHISVNYFRAGGVQAVVHLALDPCPGQRRVARRRMGSPPSGSFRPRGRIAQSAPRSLLALGPLAAHALLDLVQLLLDLRVLRTELRRPPLRLQRLLQPARVELGGGEPVQDERVGATAELAGL